MRTHPEDAGSIGSEHRAALLVLARRSLEDYLVSGVTKPETENDPGLPKGRWVFVTLHCDGRLRGCIGLLDAGMSLPEAVSCCAVSAANDPRFPPLTAGELDATEIEISVLMPGRAVSGPEEIAVGRHGLIVSLGHRRGLLLPQVALEHGWGAQKFVEETCVKAGLPRDAWRSGATVEIFTAEVFSEGDLGRMPRGRST